MALTLDTTSGLFAKVGAFYKAIVNAESTTGLSDNDRAEIITNIRQAAQKYLIAAVQADTPIQPVLYAALREVVLQARDQSESCDAGSYSGSVTTSGMTALSFRSGGGVTRLYDQFGNPMYNSRPHTLRIDCIGAPSAGMNYSSRWQISSTPLLPFTSATWFSGLGYSSIIGMGTAQVDGSSHITGQNMLTNGGFERFGGTTAKTPDNWTATTWTAGTHFNAVTTPYIGTNALRLIGDGSTNGKIRQILADSSGTPIALQARTNYGLSVMIRGASGVLTAGIIRISIENAAGTELYSSGLAIDGTTDISTTYTEFPTWFFTGDTVSATNYVVIETTTAITNTEAVYLDEIILSPTYIIPGFGRITWNEGSAAAQVGDFTTIAISNDGTATQLLAWERLFDMSRYDLCMPVHTGGSETILDSLSVTTPA